MIRGAAFGLFIFLCSVPAKSALEGTVLDGDGKPIKGARACFLVGDAEGLCVLSDEKGRFLLPESRVDRYRVVADGFIGRVVPTKDHASVLVLDRAAVLAIRIENTAGGENPVEAEVFLILPNGQRQGPFPGNSAGLDLQPLPPGVYGVLIRADGFSQDRGVTVTVEAGSRQEVTVRVSPDPPADEGEEP
jgi:hypothetical protein